MVLCSGDVKNLGKSSCTRSRVLVASPTWTQVLVLKSHLCGTFNFYLVEYLSHIRTGVKVLKQQVISLLYIAGTLMINSQKDLYVLSTNYWFKHWTGIAQAIEHLPAWCHTGRQQRYDKPSFWAPQMPTHRYIEAYDLAAMLATKRSASVALEVNLWKVIKYIKGYPKKQKTIYLRPRWLACLLWFFLQMRGMK